MRFLKVAVFKREKKPDALNCSVGLVSVGKFWNGLSEGQG